MYCCWCCCGNKADKGVYDMGQRFAKKSSVSEQATPCKELISNDLGSHVEVKSALDVGTTVKHTDSSQDVHEEEMEEVDAPHLATLHGGMEPNTESKEQIETTSTALSNVGPCIEKPTASSGGRKSPSPQAEPPPMPFHITPQVSKHPPTHPSVSVGGSTSGSGSGQQLVIPIKPQADGSDRHQQQSDGAPSPTSPSSPGKDGSNTHTPDGLSNRATAEGKKETTGGSHLKDKTPAPDHDSREGRTEEPTGSAQDEREHAGTELMPANGSAAHAEPLASAAQDTGFQGVGLGEGQDSHKQQQQQGKAGSQGKWPGVAQRVESPQTSGAEDALTSLKCVDCERQLSAEEIRQRKEQGEALLCNECRSAHLSCLQDDSDGKGSLDQANVDTRSSPNVVPEGPMCKLPGCPKQAQMKGRKYSEFCGKGHYQMYDMMTPSPMSLKPSTFQRSPTSPIAPSQSGGEAPSCQYPGCSEVCAVENNGSFQACWEERQLRQFQECRGAQEGVSGGQRGDGGAQGVDGSDAEVDNSGGQREDSGGQGDDSGGQRDDSGDQRGDSGGQRDDSGDQRDDSDDQRDDSGDQRDDSGDQRDDSGDQRGDSGGQRDDSGGQRDDNGGQGDNSGGQGGDRGAWIDSDAQRGGSCAQRGDSGAGGHNGGPQGHYRSSRGGGHTPQYHPPSPTPRRKTCQYPGCQRPCYVEPDGHVHDFCGRTHAQQYRSQHTRSSRTAQSQHTDDESQGALGWMAGKLGALWGSTPTSHTNSGSHGNLGNREKRNSRQRGSNAIKFYHKHEPYYEFTNFYQASLQIDDRAWATSENYFQAQKYIGTPLFDAIQQSQTAREAFDISRTPGLGLQWRRCDWEEVKEDVMYVALYAKFTQHEHLRKLLLETGDCKLVEHTSRDSYWGDGGDGSGQNKLGKLLMKLREELKKEIEAVPVSQGGRKRRNEGGVELQSRAKKSSCSNVSDNGSSVD